MTKEKLLTICKLRTPEIEQAIRKGHPLKVYDPFYFDQNAGEFRAIADKATENTIDYLVKIGFIKLAPS